MIIKIKFLQSLFAFNPARCLGLQAPEEHKPHPPHSCKGETQGGEGKGGEGSVIRQESGLPWLHRHSDRCGYLVAACHFAEKLLVCHQAGSLGLYPQA